MAEARDEFHARLLYLGHAPAIKDDLSALENLQIAAAVAGPARWTRPPPSPPCAASASPGARTCLPGAVPGPETPRGPGPPAVQPGPAVDPRRPFVALDVAAVDQLCGILDEHLARGGLLLFTSHQAVHLAAAAARPEAGPMNAFVAIVRRDLLLAARRKSEVLTALFFFMIVVSLFPSGSVPRPPCCGASRRACCGSPRCWLAMLSSTACSPPTTRTELSSRWPCLHPAGRAGERQGAGPLAHLGPAAGAAGAGAGAAVRPSARALGC